MCVCVWLLACFFQQCELFRIIIETIVLKEAFDACVNLLSSCSDFHTLIPLNPTRSLWLSRIYRFRLDSNKNMHVRVECVCVGFTALDLTALCLMNAYPPLPSDCQAETTSRVTWANDNTLTFSRSLIFILTHTRFNFNFINTSARIS